MIWVLLGPGALYGVTEVWIYGDVPGLEQPFRDVEPIPVLGAPAVQLGRIEIRLWREL